MKPTKEEYQKVRYEAIRAKQLLFLGLLLLGGIVGIGTLVCAFGLGPFVQFFSNYIAKPLIYVQ